MVRKLQPNALSVSFWQPVAISTKKALINKKFVFIVCYFMVLLIFNCLQKW